MGDGRWAMGDGRWEMGDGKWEMGDGQGATEGGGVRLKTFLIVVIVALAIAAAAVAMRSHGGLLASLAPAIHGH